MTCLTLSFSSALHGSMLSFNQLQSRGNIQFPDASIQLAQFSRPAGIPQIKLPVKFVSTARRKKERSTVSETVESDAMVEVVNVVMNNIEEYLPAATINGGKER